MNPTEERSVPQDCPHFPRQGQGRASRTSERPVRHHGFPRSLSWLQQFARMAHRTQERAFLVVTVFSFVFNKIQDSRTARQRRRTGPGSQEGVWLFHALSRHVSLPAPSPVHKPRSSLSPALLGFYGGSMT